MISEISSMLEHFISFANLVVAHADNWNTPTVWPADISLNTFLSSRGISSKIMDFPFSFANLLVSFRTDNVFNPKTSSFIKPTYSESDIFQLETIKSDRIAKFPLVPLVRSSADIIIPAAC